MIARLLVQLPQVVSVPIDATFDLRDYEDTGYLVRVFPPVTTDEGLGNKVQPQVTINGVATRSANALQIDFLRNTFNRERDSPLDPPEDVVSRALRSFFTRFRTIVLAPHFRYIDFPKTPWRMQYLNDDGTELPKKDGYIRGKGSLHFSVNYAALTTEQWEKIHELSPQFSAPPWLDLLLEAQAEASRVGTAIVLAATALEVFSWQIIDELAARASIPNGLWRWLTERKDHYQNPNVEDRLDTLLKIFSGHSLKEHPETWELFKNLRSARNSFVHHGVAEIGSVNVTPERAHQLVAGAFQACDLVRDWLPDELKWPIHRGRYDLQFVVPLT